jgi:hypothetical protein
VSGVLAKGIVCGSRRGRCVLLTVIREEMNGPLIQVNNIKHNIPRKYKDP